MSIRLSRLIAGAAIATGGAVALKQIRRVQRERRREELLTRAGIEPVRRIVVVGMGFAGVAVATRLGSVVGGDPRFDVRLIDRHNYHLFFPLLYQVATGVVEPGALAYPARLIARESGFRFLEANVQRVDLGGKRLDTDAGPIEFDALILAPGGVTNFFGRSDAATNALPLKSLHDGTSLRNRVVECFEQADRETDPERRRALLTFAVVGGGATGVELVASLSDMIYSALLPNYPSITLDDARLILVEAKGTLLPGWNPRMGEIAASRLRHERVELILNSIVSKVSETGIETGDGSRVPTATVIWTAGVRAAPILDSLPGDRERDGRIRVDRSLELPGQPGVFVVGDSASFTNPGTCRPLAPTAPVAIDEGRMAAENAVRRLRGERLHAFVYHSKGDLVSLGRGAAAADLFGFVFDGLPALVARRAVYLTNLAGFRNRLVVALDWAFVSFHQRVIASFDGPDETRPALPAALARPESEPHRVA